MEKSETMVTEEINLKIEDFGEPEAKELKYLLSRFIHSYGEKPESKSDELWLKEQFMTEQPELSEADAERWSHQTIESIKEYQGNRANLADARKRGIPAEQWYASRVSEAAAGVSINDYSRKLAQIDEALAGANAQMQRVVTTAEGNISQSVNLDGFIAEQHHVSTFNAAAAMENSSYYAEVCTPEPGEVYGRNSFDIVIRDQSGRIVHQYQSKYGADAETTIRMIRDGNYNNQTLLVPPEQVEQVQAAFPGKTVVSVIGGSKKVPVTSTPLSKADAKAMQLETQNTDHAPEIGWNTYDARSAVLGIGRRAFLSGIQGAALSVGFQLAAKAMQDDPVDTEEVIDIALKTGADTGVKAAVAGALKVGAERGVIRILPPGTPAQIIANFACVGIENAKILAKSACGEITFTEALDEMGCNTVAMMYGLSWGAAGTVLGTCALCWVPIVGPIIGGVAGGFVGYMAGSKFGEKVYEGVKSATKAAKGAVKTLWNGVKKLGRCIINGIGRLFSRKRKETY